MAKGKRTRGGVRTTPFKDVTQKLHISFPFTSSWAKLGHKAKPTCARGREVQTVDLTLHLAKRAASVPKRKKRRLAISGQIVSAIR